MTLSQRLEKIKVLLGLQVSFSTSKLIDGTVLEAEDFIVGAPLFVVNEDGTKTPAPAGTHETEDGNIIEVDEAGIITAISEKEKEDAVEIEIEAEAPVDVPVEMAEEVELAEDKTDKSAMIDSLFTAFEEMAKKVAVMEADMASMKEKYEAFSKQPGAEKAPKLTMNRGEKIDPLEARIEALNQLKKDNFFKK